MIRPTWHVLRAGDRQALPAVEVTGPTIDDLVTKLVRALAEATHHQNPLYDAWAVYTLARRNRLDAETFGDDEATIEQLDDRESDAWDDLIAALPRAVRISPTEARMLTGALDEAAGRVGERAA